ncbi:DNA repair protein rhp54 [Hordeum vulgare]|nr:DNA repair protein rhp54 [Hordeum vulgare]
MNADFQAAAAIASMASSVAAPKPEARLALPKKKKELTPDERTVESAKRKGRRHAQDARGEAAAAAQQEDTNAQVKAATMEALLYLGVNPSQHGLVNVTVAAAAASTGSSTYPRMMLPESPRTSCTQLIPGFHIYSQGSCFSGECSPEVSIVAPSKPAPVTIDLNVAPVASGSSSRGMRKRQREMPADMLTGARSLFDGMSVAVDDDTTNRFPENMIFEGAPTAGVYDPDETQSQDGRAPFMQATNDPHDAFMQDQVSLDSFLLDHEFSGDYGLEEEDDGMDIDGEPLFEEELANQTAAGAKPKRKSKQTKAYTSTEDKLLCECWRDIGQDPKIGVEQKGQPYGLVFIMSFMSARSFPHTKCKASVDGCHFESVEG